MSELGKYSDKQAQEEAEIMRQMLASGEVSTYNEAEERLKNKAGQASPEKEKDPGDFEWEAEESGKYRLAYMKFPNGHEYRWSDYFDELYSYLFSTISQQRETHQTFSDIPSFNSLKRLIGGGVHGDDDVIFLELTLREYPEHIDEACKLFEESIARRKKDYFLYAIVNNKENTAHGRIAFTDLQEEGEARWFDKLNSNKFDQQAENNQGSEQKVDTSLKWDPSIIKKVTEIYLKYAPPKELSYYLPVPELQEQYKDVRIGEGLLKIRDGVESDPVGALKDVLAHLPSYNAGKSANSFNRVIKKLIEMNIDGLDESELLTIVQSNKNIGPFDSEPIIKAIRRAFEKNSDD